MNPTTIHQRVLYVMREDLTEEKTVSCTFYDNALGLNTEVVAVLQVFL